MSYRQQYCLVGLFQFLSLKFPLIIIVTVIIQFKHVFHSYFWKFQVGSGHLRTAEYSLQFTRTFSWEIFCLTWKDANRKAFSKRLYCIFLNPGFSAICFCRITGGVCSLTKLLLEVYIAWSLKIKLYGCLPSILFWGDGIWQQSSRKKEAKACSPKLCQAMSVPLNKEKKARGSEGKRMKGKDERKGWKERMKGREKQRRTRVQKQQGMPLMPGLYQEAR